MTEQQEVPPGNRYEVTFEASGVVGTPEDGVMEDVIDGIEEEGEGEPEEG